MVYTISFLIFALGVLTTVQASRMLRYRAKRRKAYILYGLAAISSALWSFGFALEWIQTDVASARFWRSVGMVGVFLFFFFGTAFFVHWMERALIFKIYALIVAIIGLCLWPFVIGEESVTFYLTSVGMTYQFTPNIWNSIYNVICVLAGLNFIASILWILKRTNRKKLKVIMRAMLLCCVVVMIGMVFDTVLPIFGYDALPGSTITQSIGTLMLARVMEFQKTSEITVENISQFVYYTVDTPVMIYDEIKKFAIANTGAVDFFGTEQKEYGDKMLCEIFSLPKNCLEFEGDRRVEEAECRLNNRFCQLEMDKIYDEYQEITGYIVVINDLTEKKNFIQKLQESEHEAERANRAKSDFLARMSHEIRTPINGIIGMNEIILKSSTDKQITDCAQMVKLSANNLVGLINDILDISKIEANHIVLEEQEYQFHELLLEAAAIAQVKAQEKNLEFKVDIKGELPRNVYGDGKKLRQVLINIMGNAFKYTREGSVHIYVEGFWKEEQYFLQIKVRDTGIGIKKENLNKIFEAFERVDIIQNQGIEGTGLGLSIAKSLIRIMGGSISVTSEYGVGTEFTIVLPQKPIGEEYFQHLSVEVQEDKSEDVEQAHVQLLGKRILVVDDNEINRIVAAELLTFTQAEIDTADSGRECLRLVKEYDYDFILLDHIMPEMDGIQVLEELKRLQDNRSKDAVHIVFTANAIRGAKEEYLEKGFDDYLSKPFNVEQVNAVLQKYC